MLRDRNNQSHQALAGEMLYKSVIGPEFPNHPEIQAFIKGFNLACRNGFNFSQVKQDAVWYDHLLLTVLHLGSERI
jgi:hypothetical protein